jgi:hypothetical protein
VPSAALRSLSPMLERLAALGVPSTDMARETIAMATRHIAYSGAKARRELGWTPRSLADGMAELAVALQAEQLVDRIARARARGRTPSRRR